MTPEADMKPASGADMIPPSFGSAELLDVEGVPVSMGNVPGCPFSCAAWDTLPPRKFSPDTARRNGGPIDEAAFRALIAEFRKA